MTSDTDLKVSCSVWLSSVTLSFSKIVITTVDWSQQYYKELKAWIHAWDTEEWAPYTTCTQSSNSEASPTTKRTQEVPSGLWNNEEEVCGLSSNSDDSYLENKGRIIVPVLEHTQN